MKTGSFKCLAVCAIIATSMRRDTRLSNGFSRKIENHIAAVGDQLLRV